MRRGSQTFYGSGRNAFAAGCNALAPDSPGGARINRGAAPRPSGFGLGLRNRPCPCQKPRNSEKQAAGLYLLAPSPQLLLQLAATSWPLRFPAGCREI